MEREVFIDETIHDERRTNEYVPISVNLYEKGEDGYKDTKFPWFRTSVRGVKKGIPIDRKSTRLNSSHIQKSRMPSSA